MVEEMELSIGEGGRISVHEEQVNNANENNFTTINVADEEPTHDIEDGTGGAETAPTIDKPLKTKIEAGQIAPVEEYRRIMSDNFADDESFFVLSTLATIVEYMKYTYSCAFLVFSLVVVHAALFTKQTVATADMGIPPIAAFLIFWFLIVWLAVMEGGQGALVGLKPVAQELYAESHPRALKNTRIAHKGDNMERFIVGRQYLVVLVITVLNLMGSAISGASVLDFPGLVNEIFLANGICMIFITIIVGHLTAQVNAANCMLDFINNYFMLFTTYLSLAIEFSGLLHCVYLVQFIFAKLAGTPIRSKEPPRSPAQKVFFWVRVMISLAILGFCLAVTLAALFDGNTGMWEGVPAYVSVIIMFVLMAIVGMLEGIQIALFAVVNLPEDDLKLHTIAYANCELAFKDSNLGAFLIGRQIFVTTCMFIVARIATPVYGVEDENIFGVPDGFQAFLNSGLTGAVITTVIGSLAWRIVASSFAVPFLSNPLIYVIIRVCLIFEGSGICSGAWVLGHINKLIVGYKHDDFYLNKEESKVPLDEAIEVYLKNKSEDPATDGDSASAC